jgi:hypothetical protein
MINRYPAWTRKGHLYWELKADYLVGPNYTKIAKDILSMDHKGCDELLKMIGGKRRNGIKAKKRLYTQSVKVSDYLYATHPMLFGGKVLQWHDFREYLALTVGLSCRLVRDFLKQPDECPFLSLDPMGRRNLSLARWNRFFPRSVRTRRPGRRFSLDHEFLEI